MLEIVVDGKPKIICGGTTQAGTPCQRPPLKGKHFCKRHGGNALKGRNHPNFTHGKYSNYLPKNLLSKYNESFLLEDPYSLREEIALLDARLMLLADHLKATGGGEILQELVSIKETIDRYSGSEDGVSKDELEYLANKLAGTLEEFSNERRRWYEIYDVIEARRRLVESEIKRDATKQKQISETQAIVLVSAIVDIMRRHIDDRGILNAIASDIDAIADRSINRITEG